MHAAPLPLQFFQFETAIRLKTARQSVRSRGMVSLANGIFLSFAPPGITIANVPCSQVLTQIDSDTQTDSDAS